jgi:transcriptional regulator with XRE-family HTH domain
MKERLLEFLKQENKSSAQFAEEIGVQASGISHILSGRNNPSLDFVLKMLEKYKFLSTDWLLFGKGSMYKEPRMQSLFDDIPETNNDQGERGHVKDEPVRNEIEFQDVMRKSVTNDTQTSSKKQNEQVVKIVWFFDDNSFDEYYPRR